VTKPPPKLKTSRQLRHLNSQQQPHQTKRSPENHPIYDQTIKATKIVQKENNTDKQTNKTLPPQKPLTTSLQRCKL
jgi:hypothetical protein